MQFVLKIETFRNFNHEIIFAKILVDRDENLSDKQVNFNSFSKLRKHFTTFSFCLYVHCTLNQRNYKVLLRSRFSAYITISSLLPDVMDNTPGMTSHYEQTCFG